MTIKNHYVVLDGLRGVAALTVVVFHLCETYSLGDPFAQVINHGYLAVDFFFLLSGFVIAYAYDDRWDSMSIWDFYKRRLIRLQPMVIMGSIVGALLFYFQAGPEFPAIASTPAWKLLLVMLIGFTLVPVGSILDIRGWEEMYPLNGPAWSLSSSTLQIFCMRSEFASCPIACWHFSAAGGVFSRERRRHESSQWIDRWMVS